MKIFFALLFVICIQLAAFAQKNEYATDPNIHYYSEKQNAADAYTNELCVLDVYYPKNTKGFATIVWFHGGGLSGGVKDLPEGLKEKGFAIVSVGYRLYPKVKCPVYIEDAAASVAWVFKNIEKYGGDPKTIFLSGHSAGAYLSCMLGLDKKWLKVYDIDANSIAGIISCSTQAITHFTIRKERGLADTKATIDEYAPIYHARPDAPPLVLITGDREMELLGRYEENAYFARMMKLVGHKSTSLHELGGFTHDMVAPACPLIVIEVNKILGEMKK